MFFFRSTATPLPRTAQREVLVELDPTLPRELVAREVPVEVGVAGPELDREEHRVEVDVGLDLLQRVLLDAPRGAGTLRALEPQAPRGRVALLLGPRQLPVGLGLPAPGELHLVDVDVHVDQL